ncbi:MarR family winged helix-turn-helix transcriptional regulator [Nocardioides stalactiti]|uniref:MarR family winged helix-turn-helix transcriptional regulator n=1 Tax=Nocardioides stalactiti TaxID=2755356 RepID=UPI00160265B1|nr:MarR family transcriptional regulator [Nocardioides stalactiti]
MTTSHAVRLRRAEAALKDRLLPLLGEQRLTMEDWRIIAVIDDEPGLAMSAVATAAVVPPATLTRHMDRIVERGLVVRHIDAADRRRVVLALSPAGRSLAERLRAEEARAIDEVEDQSGETMPRRSSPIAARAVVRTGESPAASAI